MHCTAVAVRAQYVCNRQGRSKKEKKNGTWDPLRPI